MDIKSIAYTNIKVKSALESVATQMDAAIGTAIEPVASQLADVVQDVDALEITVNRLESKNTHKYGVLWDEVNHQCTRLYDAVNITTNTANFGHFGAVNPIYDNPFDKIYPWSHRKLCNIDVATYGYLHEVGLNVKGCITAWEGDPDFKIDGTNGAVMVYTPEFWSAEKAVTGGREYVVADDFVPSFKRQEESIGARWFGVDDGTGGLTSIPGMPIAGVPMSTIHSMATSKDMTLDDIYTWSADNILMYVEYATLNSQIAVGNGVDNLYKQWLRPLIAETGVNRVVLAKADANLFIVGSIIDIGTTDGASNTARRIVTSVTEVDATNSAVNFDGTSIDVTTALYVSLHGLSNMADADLKSGSGYIGINGKSNAYYRGRVAHANLFRYVLGAYREKDTGKYWVAKNRNDAAAVDALNTSIHIDTGCTLPYKVDGVTADEEYIKDMYLYGDIPANLFVKTVGGNGTNPIGDYLSHPVKSTSNTILRAGGSSPIGTDCGRLSGLWSFTADSSSWSFSGLPFLKNP